MFLMVFKIQAILFVYLGLFHGNYSQNLPLFNFEVTADGFLFIRRRSLLRLITFPFDGKAF